MLFRSGVLVLALLVHQGGVMLPDIGDDLFLGKATFLESLDANQGLTKRRVQTLVRQEGDKTKLS